MKTRAFDPETKQWRTDFIVSPAGSVFQTTHYKMDLWELEARPNWKLSRFTGLLDKNGKEIYEGDIVELEVLTEPIRYKGTYWKLKRFAVEYKDQRYIPEDLDDSIVIGDVFLNPELLGV